MMLAEQLTRERVGPGRSVLDLCTGSGMLAIRAAQLGSDRVTAVDVSRRSVFTVRLNARLNGVRVNAVRGDLFEPVRGQRFDVIVSNPPYVPGEPNAVPGRGRARAWEAGPRGRLFLDPICAQAAEYLNPGGVILLIQSVICNEQETVEALETNGLTTTIAQRHHGPLGPRMSERVAWLRARGLIDNESHEEVILVRGEMPNAQSPVHTTDSRAA
jgi:release factor glutamine methyltransferase